MSYDKQLIMAGRLLLRLRYFSFEASNLVRLSSLTLPALNELDLSQSHGEQTPHPRTQPAPSKLEGVLGLRWSGPKPG
jgi:hypothetical protein